MGLPRPNPTKSYWIEEANSPLRDFRSTPALPTKVDVVIIGSGYCGTTAAYWLHKYTEGLGDAAPSMLMLEARDICGGATGRNGGQLRPHAYSRYVPWSTRFGPQVAMSLIEHEMAHLDAFEALLAEEGITEQVCFRRGRTFDAACSTEAFQRLLDNFKALRKDHGWDHPAVKACEVIPGIEAAVEFSQMSEAIGCVVHPAAQLWPYKFVHSLLGILLARARLNVQSHTPVLEVSGHDEAGLITIQTARGEVKTKAVLHATNAWAPHLLPNLTGMITPVLATVGALRAPEAFIKHTGAQHWDNIINDYHIELPPPYNTIIIGGAKQVLVKDPSRYLGSDAEHEQIPGVAEYLRQWPKSNVVGWESKDGVFARDIDDGGCWTGVTGTSIDAFPLVGEVPGRPGQFMAAGFTGHGMPRILLSTAHLAPRILRHLNFSGLIRAPSLTKPYPPLPLPFRITPERMHRLHSLDAEAHLREKKEAAVLSAKKDFREGTCSLGGGMEDFVFED